MDFRQIRHTESDKKRGVRGRKVARSGLQKTVVKREAVIEISIPPPMELEWPVSSSVHRVYCYFSLIVCFLP